MCRPLDSRLPCACRRCGGRISRTAGWGPKSSAAVLARFAHLEHIPTDWREWGINVANASSSREYAPRQRERVELFRTLATLRTDIHLFNDVEELRWKGLTNELSAFTERFNNRFDSLTITQSALGYYRLIIGRRTLPGSAARRPELFLTGHHAAQSPNSRISPYRRVAPDCRIAPNRREARCTLQPPHCGVAPDCRVPPNR